MKVILAESDPHPPPILGDWWGVGGGRRRRRRRRRSNLLSVGILLKPLHTNISMYTLHTVFYTIPGVLTRRICSTIKRFLMTLMCDSGEIRSWSFEGVVGLRVIIILKFPNSTQLQLCKLA